MADKCEILNDLKCMTFSKNDISRIENEAYNKALEDIFVLAKQNAYDDGIDYSIGLQKLDELIAGLNKA